MSPSGGVHTMTKRVRNVGVVSAAYMAIIAEPHGESVVVRPSRLEITAVGEALEFAVTFRAKEGSFLPKECMFGFGRLVLFASLLSLAFDAGGASRPASFTIVVVAAALC